MTMKSAISVLAALLILSLFASTASAQSTTSGIAKDSSGAVMADVKVEAASEALIERSRTVTTNGEGRYAIVDLRPGSYTVTFTIEGFNTVKQQVEVPANVTVPVDADMKPGSVGQTVEVQALVATVDVENVAHPEVLTRNDIDSVPTARNLQSVGSYIPSVHLNVPDVCPNPGGLVNPGLAQGAETIMLVAPGSRLTPQLNQLDIGARRAFVIHDRYTIKAEAQIFNVINSNVVTAEAQTLGTSITPFAKGGLGGVPTAILNPRMLRLAVQFKF